MAVLQINGKAYRMPKKRIFNPLMLDEKYTGPEPMFTGVVFRTEGDRRVAQMRAFHYYNYFNFAKSFKKDVIKYAKDELKYPKDQIELLNLSPDWSCELQSGALLRMRSRDFVLRDEEFTHIENNIKRMIAASLKKIKEAQMVDDDPNTPPKAPLVSVQDKIKNKTNETVISDLEGLLDEWMMDNSPKANVLEMMKASLLPAQAVKFIVEWADKKRAEIKDAINKESPQIVEGYSHLTLKRKKEFVGWFDGIIADAQRFGTNTKVVRVARVKKPVSLEKQLTKLKYLKASPENKLVSINPIQIIGSMELWTYNVKSKSLTRFIAEPGGGFEIKGTALLNYDKSKSLTRRLRKPDLMLADVLSSSKTKGAKAFEALTTKPSAANGRMGEDTIILKASR